MRDEVERVVPVVGIGASAGGLEALSALVTGLRSGPGACYVIVQHLSPDQPSILDQLLSPKCELPVEMAADGAPLRPDHVWIVPGGVVALIDQGRVRLVPRAQAETPSHPIDAFFGSVAEAMGRNGYCVVLSGTGSDGADGLRRIKAAGGFALAQESRGARFPGMPDSAVATGQVDFVLPAERIAGQLADLLHHHRALRDGEGQEALHKDIASRLDRITARLTEASGNDFSQYKPGTLIRRIERRMALLRVQSAERLVDILEEDQKQAEILAQEFLIGVTSFFRDPEAFERLRELVVRPLVLAGERTIRVWVPGCSTGEEVYSLAILFQEEMEREGRRGMLQVFGTDVDTPALVQARYGLFPASALGAMGKERRERYFVPEAGQYRAAPSLREACVFAPHNLVQDPPFSRLDLISCRNLLIYLSTELQSRVIPRFHFALRGDGYLFLGPSEGIAGLEALFRQVDKRSRIFQRNAGAQPRYSALQDAVRRPRRSATTPPSAESARVDAASVELTREILAEREFLARHAAPFALVSSDGVAGYLSQRMVDYVKPTPGSPSDRLDMLLVRELRLPARTALREARETGKDAEVREIALETGGVARLIDLKVSPIRSQEEQFLLSLSEVRTSPKAGLRDALERRENGERDFLEAENFNLRRQLTAALQEYETSGQELKSSNEELLSMNEELQSANEELETSREELQSINEELETVNAELQENNRQLVRVNSDLKNLFESTDVAILFLDREFCLRNYTPVTTDLFRVRQRDIGRPLWDLASRIDYPSLRRQAERVDRTLQPIEEEVHVEASDETFLMRIKPYRTTENVIDGYVVSFVDITARKRYEDTLSRQSEVVARQYAELENLYDTTPVGLALIGRDLSYLRVNERIAEIDGYDIDEYEGKTIPELMPQVADKVGPCYEKVFAGEGPVLDVEIATTMRESGNEVRYFIADFYPVMVEDTVYAAGLCVREVTPQVAARSEIERQNAHQKLLLGELQHRVKNTLAMIRAISKMLLSGTDDARIYQQRLAERLGALARTHDLLTDADWAAISFGEIVAAEAKPFNLDARSRVSVEGDRLDLSSQQAASLGMAVHELMTNAAKYGALSVEGGRVTINVALKDGRATIHWAESGGPRAEPPPPDRAGFGTMVLQRVLRSDLQAETEVSYPPQGLQYEIAFGLERS